MLPLPNHILYASVYVKLYKQMGKEVQMGHTQLKVDQAIRNLHLAHALITTENMEWKYLMEACVEVWEA